MMLTEDHYLKPLLQERIGMSRVWEDTAKVWGEFGKVYKTLSRVWLGIAFTLVLFLIHLIFSHILVGA